MPAAQMSPADFLMNLFKQFFSESTVPTSDVQLHRADVLHEYGKIRFMTTDDGSVFFLECMERSRKHFGNTGIS